MLIWVATVSMVKASENSLVLNILFYLSIFFFFGCNFPLWSSWRVYATLGISKIVNFVRGSTSYMSLSILSTHMHDFYGIA